jgi:hypothetical protein
LLNKTQLAYFISIFSNFFCTFERNNNKLRVMKNSSISYIIALFLCSLACYAAAVLPNKTTQPLLSVSQQQTYKVSGTVIDAKTHTIIPEAIILLKNLTTGQENTYSCDQYGTYMVVLDVKQSYLLQATAKGYVSSEQIAFKENSNDPEQAPLKMLDFTLSKK